MVSYYGLLRACLSGISRTSTCKITGRVGMRINSQCEFATVQTIGLAIKLYIQQWNPNNNSSNRYIYIIIHNRMPMHDNNLINLKHSSRNFQDEFQTQHIFGLTRFITQFIRACSNYRCSFELDRYQTHICRVTGAYRWPTKLDPLSDTHL